jgi:hypothetical protein
MVEKKINESFGPKLDEWRTHSSPGKNNRLNFLLRTLSISALPSGDIRYQLLIWVATAVITCEQYRVLAAVLLVHSFMHRFVPSASSGLVVQGCQASVRVFGVHAIFGAVKRLPSVSRVPLFTTWVAGHRWFLKADRLQAP